MAEVTKRHRELAVIADYGSVDALYLVHVKQFVDSPSVDATPSWMRLAQALADIEAEAIDRVHSQRGCEYCECDDCKRRK